MRMLTGLTLPLRSGRFWAALALCTALGACSNFFPELPPPDDAGAQEAAYPALIPLGPILAQARGAAQPATGESDAARLAALAARAEALRGPVVPDATSARMTNSLR